MSAARDISRPTWPDVPSLTRRAVIVGGAAIAMEVAWMRAVAQEGTAATPAGSPSLPGSLKVQPKIDGWIRIGTDGAITVFSGKAELGQGIRTALIQVAAEELMVPPARVTLVTADTDRTANEGYTAGSHSMQDSGTAIRFAAAQVRTMLVTAAAQRFGVAPEQVALSDGIARCGNAHAGYGELIPSDALHVDATPKQVTLREPASHAVIGRSVPRVDIPAKVSGGVAYLQDMRLPGMVHGRIVRPPSPGAQLRALDESAVLKSPGVLKVVRDGRFIGVIATREFQAVVAARLLKAASRWDETPIAMPAPADLPASLRSEATDDYVILDVGKVDALPNVSLIEANYGRPYQMHGSIGPSCAVAQLVEGKTTVWTHTQGVFPQRKALAELLGVAEPQVRCIHVEGSGCYGHNGADDVAADAALLARSFPGRPVRVQWMREDEHGYEPLGPPMSTRVRATLDPTSGSIAGWNYEVWSNTHNGRPGGAGDMLAGTLIDKPFTPSPPKPIPQPEGGGDRNAIPLYAFPNSRVTHHFIKRAPLRVSALRSLGAYFNIFSIESFVDELARAAHADPVAFRLKHLTDPRAIDVVKRCADEFGWNAFARRPMVGRGFAFARYKNLAAFAAIACEVEVWRDTGELRISRVVAVVDSGEVVNPDGIRNQIEGGIVQSISWTTVEEAAYGPGGVTARDWGGYPILRFPQVPRRIDVHIIDRPGQPFLGTGEAAQGPAAAALANAVADASGVRMRMLPLTRERVREALVS